MEGMSMSERSVRSYLLIILSVFAVALAARAAPLYWSPLPATLDAFRYATLAREILVVGTIPATVIDADELVFTNALATVSAVTGVRPLYVAQPFVATIGAAAPLVGVALARRVGLGTGLDPRRVYLAATLAGMGLALDGLFLRRTGVPDEEALGLLLVPLVVLAAHRWLASERPGWGVVTLVLLSVLPPLHNMSSLVGVFSLTALGAIHTVRATNRPAIIRGVAVPAVAWGNFVGYYELAEWLGLNITFSGLVRPYPGLLLAWVVLLVVGATWVRTRTERAGRAGLLSAVGLGFFIVGINAITPLFPGTVPSPPAVASLIAFLVVPTVLAAVALPRVREGTGVVILSLFAAPVVLTYYSLSASLTPEFFGAVLRIQGFAHVPAFVLAGLGAVAVGARLGPTGLSPRLRTGLRWVAITALVVSVLLTVPLGYVNLDTGSYPSTTFRSEFETVGFATEHLEGPLATDHTLQQMNTHYTRGPNGLQEPATGATAAVGPTRSWLTGGPPPGCPTVIQRSWTTTGAHLFPAPPGTLPPDELASFAVNGHVVYSVSGHDPLRVVVPTANATGAC